MELYLILKQWCPMILAMALLLWDDLVRETWINKQITKLEKEYRQGRRGGSLLGLMRPPRPGGDPDADRRG